MKSNDNKKIVIPEVGQSIVSNIDPLVEIGKTIVKGYNERESKRLEMLISKKKHVECIEKSDAISNYREKNIENLTGNEKEMLTEAFCRNILK